MARYENGAVSPSALSVLKRSPQEFYQKYIAETWEYDEPTDTLKLGSLVHCMALEPDRVNDRFAVAPDVDGRTREGKAAKAAFAAASDGKTIVSATLEAKASMIVNALHCHGEAELMLRACSRPDAMIEKQVYGEWNGTQIAGTPDLVLLNSQLIYDVKTTQDASPSGFARSVADYGYHRQAAMYLELLEQGIGCTFRFMFACVETKPPYQTAVYELDYAAIMQGRSEVIALLEQYETRRRTNDWISAWGKGVVSLSLPRWYRDEMFSLEDVA